MKLFSLFCYLFICLLASAQPTPRYLDSLEKELAASENPRQKNDLLFALGEGYWFSREMKEAVYFLQSTISFANSSNDTRHACNAQLLLGNVYIKLNIFDSAFYYLNQSLACSKANQQPEHIPKVDESLSLLYHILGDNEKAITLGLNAVDGYEASSIPAVRSLSVFAWLGVGRIVNEQGQFEKAKTYFIKAFNRASQMKDTGFIVPCIVALAGNSYDAGYLDESKRYFMQALGYCRSSEQNELMVEIYKGLGKLSLKEKNPQAATDYFQQAVGLCQQKNLLVLLPSLYLHLGDAWLDLNAADSAAAYLQKTSEQVRKTGQYGLQKPLYQNLAKLSLLRGDKKQAIKYLQKAQELSDSMYAADKYASIGKLEILYETEKKEKEIYALNAENDGRKMALSRRKGIILIISITAIIALTVLLLLYRNSWQKKMLAIKERELKDEEVKFLEGQQQVISLQSMVNGQEAERSRIAKDLHDGLGGLFSTIKMYFSTLKHEQKNLEESLLFSKSYQLIDTAAEEVRRIAHNMMPEVLMKLGLIPALRDMCSNITAGKLLQVQLQSYGMEQRLNASTEIMLYRIVQELLNNIIKHAQATEVIVQFNRDDNRLMVTVEDNGRGFDLSDVDQGNHAGLDAVRSRVSYLNGNISIDSQTQVGTTVMMEFLLHSPGETL